MSYLLASGCSWTDANFKSTIIPNYDASFPKWPALLGEKLGISKVVNVGRSGASNDSIFKKCYDEIFKQKPKLVCVLITDWSRHSVFDSYSLNTFDLLATENAVSKNEFPKELDSVRDWLIEENSAMLFAKKLWSSTLCVDDIVRNTLREIWLFQNFCEKNDIDYIIMSGLDPISAYHLTLLNRDLAIDYEMIDLINYIKNTLKSPYANNLNKNTLLGWPFFEEIGGYSVWTNFINKYDNVFVHRELDFHPNGLGHQLIAEMFYRGYRNIYGKIS
jgi:hypothetical protein